MLGAYIDIPNSKYQDSNVNWRNNTFLYKLLNVNTRYSFYLFWIALDCIVFVIICVFSYQVKKKSERKIRGIT